MICTASEDREAATHALRRYLLLLASLISIGIFSTGVAQCYLMGKSYEKMLTERLANSMSGEISRLAYTDQSIWAYQSDRINSQFEHQLQLQGSAGRGWSIQVYTINHALVFESHAEESPIQSTVSRPILLGTEVIGYLKITSQDYSLVQTLYQQASIAATISLTVFLLLVAIPFRALRKKDDALRNALVKAEAGIKSKREFLSTVSHELRTPMTSIKGSLDLLKSGSLGDLSAQARRVVDIAAKNSNLLVVLVNDLLDYEKLDAGKMEIDRVSTDIVCVIDDAIEIFGQYGASRGIEVTRTANSSIPPLNLDSKRITQVLGNLISNAVKFSPPHAPVSISVSHGKDAVRVTVRDFGCGVAEKHRETIFQAFVQGDSSDARAYNGTGLGLSISKKIVEYHGGTIGIAETSNKGSSFYFDLPIALADSENDGALVSTDFRVAA